VQAARIKNQLQHITEMLDEVMLDPPTWLIVSGHYPVYSAGSQGDVSELMTYLLPLLQQYKVHAYLCGHDHISEHLQMDGTEYFVVGAGSMTDQLKYTSAADLVWYGVGYSAFAYMDATASSLEITFIDVNNTVRYSYALTNHGISSSRSQYIFRNIMIAGSIVVFGIAAFILSLYRDRIYDIVTNKEQNQSTKSRSLQMENLCPNHDAEYDLENATADHQHFSKKLFKIDKYRRITKESDWDFDMVNNKLYEPHIDV